MHAQGGLPIPGIVHIAQPYWYGEGGDAGSAGVRGLGRPRSSPARSTRSAPTTSRPSSASRSRAPGGVDHTACELLAGRPADLPGARYPARLRRGDLRLRTHRLLVRLRAFRLRARPDGRWRRASRRAICRSAASWCRTASPRSIGNAGDFNHGFTYSGHPAACAAAIANINILRDEKIVDYVRDDIGPYMQSKWLALGDHPMVGEARMIGLIGALELTPSKATRASWPVETGTVGHDRPRLSPSRTGW